MKKGTWKRSETFSYLDKKYRKKGLLTGTMKLVVASM